MITVILPISYSGGFDNLKRILLSLESDIALPMSFLAIVSDPDLYLQVRDYLNENVDFAETLTVYTERERPLLEALFHIGASDYVFLWNENVVFPSHTLSRLLKDYTEQPGAGFISGHFAEYPLFYWVDDIYAKQPQRILSNERELEGLVEVDLGWTYGMLTKTTNFKDYFSKPVNGFLGGTAYGLTLRRKGFKNFVDTNIQYRYGGKNENNHVKGSAS